MTDTKYDRLKNVTNNATGSLPDLERRYYQALYLCAAGASEGGGGGPLELPEYWSNALVDLDPAEAIVENGYVVSYPNSSLIRDQRCFFDTASVVTTDDKAALNMTGTLQTWTFYNVDAPLWLLPAGVFKTLAAQWSDLPDKRSWRCSLGEEALFLHFTLDGVTEIEIGATAWPNPALLVDTIRDLKITRDSVTGDVNFYFNYTAGDAFQQWGTTVSGPAGTLYDASSPVSIGAWDTLNTIQEGWNGHIGRTIIEDDATVVLHFDPRQQTELVRPQPPMVSNGDTYVGVGARYRDLFDVDVVSGTAANLRKHDAGSLLINGTGTSGVTTPDASINSPTGSCILYGCVNPTDNSPGATLYSLIGKYQGTASNRGFLLSLYTAGVWQLDLSSSGTSSNAYQSVATGIADNTPYWIFAAIDVGNTVTFYTSLSEPSATPAEAWGAKSALGTPISITEGSIFDSSLPLNIGAYQSNGAGRWNGLIYKAGIIFGLDGSVPPSTDFDPAEAIFPLIAGGAFVCVDTAEYTLAGNARTTPYTTIHTYGSVKIASSTNVSFSQPYWIYLANKMDIKYPQTTAVQTFIAPRDAAANGMLFTTNQSNYNDYAAINVSQTLTSVSYASGPPVYQEYESTLMTLFNDNLAGSTLDITGAQRAVTGISITRQFPVVPMRWCTLFGQPTGTPKYLLGGSIARVTVFSGNVDPADNIIIQEHFDTRFLGAELATAVPEYCDVNNSTIPTLVADIESGVLVPQTGTTPDIQAEAYQLLGYTGSVLDQERKYLNFLGYTGGLADMQKQYWADYN